MTESREAYADLLAVLEEIGARFAGEEWGITDPNDVAETLRATMHLLASGIETQFDDDASRPVLRQLVTPWRKSLGDNADAMYHDAKVHPAGVYRVRGRTGGSVYVSCTVEAGAEEGGFPTGTVGVLNDSQFDVDADGRFALLLGGPPRDRNWLGLASDASRLTIRHYWEKAEHPAIPPAPDLALRIDLVDGDVPSGRRAPDDRSVAASIRRASNYVRGRTIEAMAKPGDAEPPAFVSRIPHVFPAPVSPGSHALAATDAAYSMAPYLLGPDEALVITARWPECRCANVNLWNRQLQTFDYLRHRISLNRAQTVPDADGSFRVVIADRDPGVGHWLDTEGRPFGLVFWRYMLPEGSIDTPQAQVVPLASLR